LLFSRGTTEKLRHTSGDRKAGRGKGPVELVVEFVEFAEGVMGVVDIIDFAEV